MEHARQKFLDLSEITAIPEVKLTPKNRGHKSTHFAVNICVEYVRAQFNLKSVQYNVELLQALLGMMW